MKYLIFFLLFFLTELGFTQTTTEIIQEIKEYHASENDKFGNAETTVLEPKDFEHFDGLQFFPIDLDYRVMATFIRTPNEAPFEMATTTERLAMEVKYGEIHFEIKGQKMTLELYQSVPPMTDPEYVDYLFLPFTDVTNADGSYGGGRFLDVTIPEGETMVIDFNKAYNPYCAYNPNYSCPIPPETNDLPIRIEAGVKYTDMY